MHRFPRTLRRCCVVIIGLNLRGVGVGGVEVEIPWAALKQYLVAKPPFPIAF
jgi:hypothetical protein